MDDFLCADNSKLTQRTYNLQAVSFTPQEISDAIKKRVKGFSIAYNPDFRQKIAESWPRVLDDTKVCKTVNFLFFFSLIHALFWVSSLLGGGVFFLLKILI